jgi:hypothetical protein
MDWKKLAFGALLSGSLVATGCGDDDSGMMTPDTGMPMVDAGPPTPAECGGDDCFFVVDELSIPVADSAMPNVVNGFDLDGRNSDETDLEGCGQPDFIAPDGREGIDNQLSTLAPLLEMAAGNLDETIATAIAEGSILLLAEYTADGGPINSNGSGSLSLYLGQTTDGGAPMVTGDTLTPGQTFNLDPAGNPITTVPVTVVSGTATASVEVIALAIPFDETTTINLNIRDARVQATITGDTLVGGIIGGGLNVDELVTTVMAVAPDFDAMMLRNILEGVTDLEPDTSGICQSLSVGLEFHAVAAVKGTTGT